MRRSRLLAPLLGLLCAGLLGACGSGSPASLDPATASGLEARFAAVAADARADRRAAALGSLRQASLLVDRAARAGRLRSGELSALRTGIARARARVLVELPVAAAATPPAAATATTPTPAATVTTPTPAPTPPATPPPPPGKGHGKGHDHPKPGKGPGHGGGGGD